MKTLVVNLRLEPYDFYIGRAGKGQSGYYGNDHVIGFCNICGVTHTREESIQAFRDEFHARILADKEFKDRVLELKGKRLGCFCKQKFKEIPCHGDIYVEYLDGQDSTTD